MSQERRNLHKKSPKPSDRRPKKNTSSLIWLASLLVGKTTRTYPPRVAASVISAVLPGEFLNVLVCVFRGTRSTTNPTKKPDCQTRCESQSSISRRADIQERKALLAMEFSSLYGSMCVFMMGQFALELHRYYFVSFVERRIYGALICSRAGRLLYLKYSRLIVLQSRNNE